MEKVTEILKELEAKHDIHILFALEAGSRAWKLESQDSDYDIRFVYMYKDVRKYLSLGKMDKTIDGFSEDRVYDWQGWDIQKALRHIHEMNPSICEWLHSPIVYLNDSEINFQQLSRGLLYKKSRVMPLLYHYKSMAKKNYKSNIGDAKQVKVKKYLNVIRPAGMFVWLLHSVDKETGTVDLRNFEIDFMVILEAIKDHMSAQCHTEINRIIDKKKSKMNELDLEPRVACIDAWIDFVLGTGYDKEMKRMSHLEKNEQRTNALGEYDETLFSILKI